MHTMFSITLCNLSEQKKGFFTFQGIFRSYRSWFVSHTRQRFFNQVFKIKLKVPVSVFNTKVSMEDTVQWRFWTSS